MGCASSKPSDSTSNTRNKKTKDLSKSSKKTKSSSSNSDSQNNKQNDLTNNNTANNTTNLNENDESVKVDLNLLEQIKANENLIIAYIVKRVHKDLNNELVKNNTTSTASVQDNEDLIIDVSSKAVNLIEHSSNQSTFTYKSLNHSLKSWPFLCKNQSNKSRICDLTVDTVRECLNNLNSQSDINLAEYLTSSPDFKYLKDTTNTIVAATTTSVVSQNPILMSRTEANELARMLFLSNRGRPVVHASSNIKDAYYVNKCLDNNTELTVTQDEIDNILNINLVNSIIPPPFTHISSDNLNEETKNNVEITWSTLVIGKEEKELLTNNNNNNNIETVSSNLNEIQDSITVLSTEVIKINEPDSNLVQETSNFSQLTQEKIIDQDYQPVTTNNNDQLEPQIIVLNDECSIETVEIVNKTADENVETTNAVLACALEAEPKKDAVEQENIINVLGSDTITLTNTNELVPNSDTQSETTTNLSVSGSEPIKTFNNEEDIVEKTNESPEIITTLNVSGSEPITLSNTEVKEEAEQKKDSVEQENIINVIGSDPITLTNTEEEIVVVKNEQVPNIQSETITLNVSGNEQVATSESTDIYAKSDKADNTVTNGDVSKSIDKDNTENSNNNENLNSGY